MATSEKEAITPNGTRMARLKFANAQGLSSIGSVGILLFGEDQKCLSQATYF